MKKPNSEMLTRSRKRDKLSIEAYMYMKLMLLDAVVFSRFTEIKDEEEVMMPVKQCNPFSLFLSLTEE
jgi:hypothetical protein